MSIQEKNGLIMEEQGFLDGKALVYCANDSKLKKISGGGGINCGSR